MNFLVNPSGFGEITRENFFFFTSFQSSSLLPEQNADIHRPQPDQVNSSRIFIFKPITCIGF